MHPSFHSTFTMRSNLRGSRSVNTSVSGSASACRHLPAWLWARVATGGHPQHRQRQSCTRFLRSSSSRGAARKPLSHTVARCPTHSRWATRASPSAAPQPLAADMLQVCRAVALLLTEVGWWPRGPDRAPVHWGGG